MSKKYKFSSNDKLHFVTFTVTNWIDLFIRNEYRDILIESIQFVKRKKIPMFMDGASCPAMCI